MIKHMLPTGAASVALLVVLSCSQNGPVGVGGGTGGGTSSAGGAVGAGGDTGNSPGGMNATDGGATTSGAGGTVSTGGMLNNGGTGATGQTSGGASAVSGATGGAATGGTPATLTPATIVPALDGYLWVGLCSAGTAQGLDCPIYDDANTCPNTSTSTPFAQRGAFQNHTITVGGTTGTNYTINFELRGIMGGRCYTGGSMRTPTVITDFEGSTGNDGWYVGGTPVDSKWNTWEIHVLAPGTGTETAVYYLNAFPSTSAYCERHETFIFKYSASIAVQGGGTLKLVLHDSNCLGQQNCGGVDNQSTCATPRSVDLTGMTPAPPATFTQPYKENNFNPQWVYIDAKTVTSP